MNYIVNSKNRKLKSRFLSLVSRLQFGASHTSFVEKLGVLSVSLLIVSLFFSWFRASLNDNAIKEYSPLTGLIGTGMALPVIFCISLGTLFFLFSQKRKEKVRSYILGGIMDGQIYMFFAVILLVVLMDIKTFSWLYYSTGAPVESLSGYIMANIASIGLFITGYLSHKSEKHTLTKLAYIDRVGHSELDDYGKILHGTSEGHTKNSTDKKKNMSLPI